MQPTVDHCENCGRAIGRLEQPYVWHKHVVCAACHLNLSSAPATIARASSDPRAKHPEYRRPAGDAPPLPLAPPPPVVPHHGPAGDPFAVKPEAPAAAAPPMFMCSECGQSFNFDDISSDHGRLVCRACALKVAAQRRANARRSEPGEGFPVGKVVLTGVGLAAVAAVVFGVYTFLDTAFAHRDRAVAGAEANALEVRQPAAPAQSQPPTPAVEPVVAAQATPAPPVAESAAGELFPHVPPAGGTSVAPTPAPPPAPVSEAPVAEPRTPTGESSVKAATAVAEVTEPQSADSRPQQAARPAGATAQKATEKPAAGPAAPEPPKGTPAWHAYRGRELLSQGKARPALEEFANAVRLDRDYPDAYHGIGLAYALLGDSKLSIERLEKAVSLYDPPNRAAVFNLAAAHLKNNPMRAAKLAKDYLARPDTPTDEAMHNLMGAALWKVDGQGRQNRAFAEAENFYFAYNALLETGRPDERKRWGSEWLTASEATRKWTDYKGKRQNVERLRLVHGRAAKAAKDAHNKSYEQASALKLHSDQEKRRVRENYQLAVKRVDEVRQQLQKAEQEFAYAEKPPLPLVVPYVPMEPVAAAAPEGPRAAGS